MGIHLVPPTDSGQSVNSDWYCFPLSLSGWVGGWGGGDKKDAWREIKERKPEREIKQVQKQMLAGYFSDPLSAKETQQQIAALHCQIYP